MRPLLFTLLVLAASPLRAQISLVAAPCVDCGSFVSELTDFDSWLYFIATDQGEYGEELWRTDGTTTERFDLYPGFHNSSYPAKLTPFRNWLYFTAETPEAGRELWRTDGSTFERVADVRTGSQGSNPVALTPAGEYLYFIAEDGTGHQLWRTDGWQTEKLASLLGEPVYSLSIHAYFGGWVYFDRTMDGYSYLWRTDGATIEPVGGLFTYGDPGTFAEFGGWLYFAAGDGTGMELWRTNGAVLEQAADLNSSAVGSTPVELTPADEWLYFRARGGDNWTGPLTLWRTRGTGAEPVAGIACPIRLTPHDGWLYLVASAEDDPNGCDGRELWRTSGQVVERVADVRPGSYGSFPSDLIPVGDRLYFSADDQVRGRELWYTDGTDTALVQDLNQGEAGSDPRLLKEFRGSVYFSASTDAYNSALWRTGGAPVANGPETPHTMAGLSFPSPNPFRVQTAISFLVPTPQRVTVAVYDALGRRVDVLFEATAVRGQDYNLTFEASDLPAGVYVIRLEGESFANVRRVTLVP